MPVGRGNGQWVEHLHVAREAQAMHATSKVGAYKGNAAISLTAFGDGQTRACLPEWLIHQPGEGISLLATPFTAPCLTLGARGQLLPTSGM